MKAKCENCKQKVEILDAQDRKKYKCPHCSRKGIYLPLAEPEKVGYDGVLFRSS